MYRLLTLNLNSSTGGKAYGIPRKFATVRLRTVLLHLPRTRPHFVLTRGSLESMNEPLARTSMHVRNTRVHMHRQITSDRRRSVDIVYRAWITYVKWLKCSITYVNVQCEMRTAMWHDTFNSCESDESAPNRAILQRCCLSIKVKYDFCMSSI